ncbi:hypothetical protein HRG_000643 [Hirsutella rhossiliensis]|uniref:DUF7907 domain-containing protein n=1 Tax=Hirsutella rhossiliensis TaxID=111463 RepID=A0A9P8SPA3_9HYPO|nr:uncharacterized protein HRG_00643 [Hirsutella rhossiliensis]KAH0968001.1 hypothetical protein HRG_00643 [Hirsutella rhossiliensis]
MKEHALFLALAAVVAASPQLLVPNLQPALTENFQLSAHAYPSRKSALDRSIESWEVVSEPRGCNCPQSLTLSKPLSNGTSAAETFYFNPDSLTVQSGPDEAPRGVVLSRKENRWALRLVPGEEGTSNLGVALKSDGPQLDYQRGRFYACETGTHSHSTVELFWRHEHDTEALSRSCVDVSLYATPADGPSHGPSSVVVACMDVRGGTCIFPFR